LRWNSARKLRLTISRSRRLQGDFFIYLQRFHKLLDCSSGMSAIVQTLVTLLYSSENLASATQIECLT
jgi:hypothetical protein